MRQHRTSSVSPIYTENVTVNQRRLGITTRFILNSAMPSTAAEQTVSNKDVAKYFTEAKDLAGGKRWPQSCRSRHTRGLP